MRFGTDPEDAGAAGDGRGLRAPGAPAPCGQWSQQFDVPLLSLTPIDTIKQLVLNPTQLGTVQAAQALLARTDSTRQALEQGFKALDIRGTVDSARALADRLSRPIRGSSASTAPARPSSRCSRRLKQLDAARKRIDGLRAKRDRRA